MTDDVVNGSQQQYLVRNSAKGAWSNGVWNQVFAGVDGAPTETFPDPPYTTLGTTPVSREKPFLHRDDGGRLQVRVPSLREESAGVSWAAGQTPGRSIPLTSFFVADPADSARTIDRQLAVGRHLLLTPGTYDVDQTIRVTRPGTVVLGLGLAALTAVDGAVPMRAADVPGVDIAGIAIDAGEDNSPILLEIGRSDRGGTHDHHHPDHHRRDGRDDRLLEADPITLHDIFFRIGGPHVGRADTSLVVNTDHVVLDHI